MRKKQFGKLISLGLTAALTLTSVVPGGSLTAYAEAPEKEAHHVKFDFGDATAPTGFGDTDEAIQYTPASDGSEEEISYSLETGAVTTGYNEAISITGQDTDAEFVYDGDAGKWKVGEEDAAATITIAGYTPVAGDSINYTAEVTTPAQIVSYSFGGESEGYNVTITGQDTDAEFVYDGDAGKWKVGEEDAQASITIVTAGENPETYTPVAEDTIVYKAAIVTPASFTYSLETGTVSEGYVVTITGQDGDAEFVYNNGWTVDGVATQASITIVTAEENPETYNPVNGDTISYTAAVEATEEHAEPIVKNLGAPDSGYVWSVVDSQGTVIAVTDNKITLTEEYLLGIYDDGEVIAIAQVEDPTATYDVTFTLTGVKALKYKVDTGAETALDMTSKKITDLESGSVVKITSITADTGYDVGGATYTGVTVKVGETTKSYADGAWSLGEITAATAVSVEVAESTTPSLTVMAPTITDFGSAFGNKEVSDIQENIAFVEPSEGETAGKVTGTLKQVVGWTQFGGEGLTSGHYISFKVKTTGSPSKIEASVVNGDGNVADLTNDPDKTALLRIRNKDTQQIKVSATFGTENPTTITKIYDLKDLVIGGFAASAEFGPSEQDLFGKTPAQLQRGIEVSATAVTGALEYIDDYTSAFGEGMDSGHYLALNVDIPNATKLEYGIKDTYTTEATDAEKTAGLLDREVVLFVDAESLAAPNGVLKLKATYADGSTEDRQYDVSELILKEAAAPSFSVVAPTVTTFGEAFGNKTPADLQTGIAFVDYDDDGGYVTGTLKQVVNWTQFGTNLSSGHYISFKVDAPGTPSSIVASLENGDGNDADLTNDPDKTAIFRIRNKDNQRLKVTVTYPGYDPIVKYYFLGELKIEGFEASSVFGANEQDLLGKKPRELQSNVEVSATSITGRLNFLTDYTGFSSDPAEQVGNYLALNVDIPNATKLEYGIKRTYTTSATDAEKKAGLLDRELVLIVDEDSLGTDEYGVLKLKATYADGSTEDRWYYIGDLTLEDAASGLTITAPTITNFGTAFGNKKVSDIQRSITISDPYYEYSDGYIYGKLMQVVGWTEFGGTGLTSGHYLSFKVIAPGATRIVAHLDGGDGNDADLTNDPDKTALFRIRNKDTQVLEVTATYANGQTVKKSYDLSGLTLDGFAADTNIPADEDLFGKTVVDLQKDVKISNYGIEGNLNYISEYTGFSSVEAEQKGHYLVVNVDIPNATKLEYGIKKTYTTEATAAEKEAGLLDRELVLLVDDDSLYRPLNLKATYADGSTEDRQYYLSELNLIPKDPTTVTFVYNNGSPDETITVAKESLITEPLAYLAGYTLEGWYKEATFTTKWNFASNKVTANTTLYGKWVANKYKVHFDANGGTAATAMADQEFTYDKADYLTANAYTKENYEFVGWKDVANNAVYSDGQKVKNLTTVNNGSINLTAMWVPAHVHDWEDTWQWADNNRSAKLILKCKNGTADEKFEFDVAAQVSEVELRTTYIVEFTFDGYTYRDSKTFINGSTEPLDKETVGYVGIEDYRYTGKKITQPGLKVYWGDSILVEGTDYTLKYANNINVGEATVTITGKGQYDKAFTETVKFNIYKANISQYDFAAADMIIFDTDKVAAPKLQWNGKNVNAKFYTVVYPEGVQAKQKAAVGSYELILRGDEKNFTGERYVTLTVIKKGEALPMSKLPVKIVSKAKITQEQVDDPEGYVPELTVGSGKTAMKATDEAFDELFDVEYYNNRSAGKATVIITARDGAEFNGKNIYGSVQKTFNIPGIKFSKAQKAELNVIKNKTVPYTGEAYYLDHVLGELGYARADYAPSLGGYWYASAYAKNIKKGTMTITITGYGIYKDSLKIPVKIGAYTDYTVSFDGLVDENDGEANEIAYMAGGTKVTGLTVRALDGDFFLREGVDYTVSYENNKLLWNSAKNKKTYAQLVIKGKGNYGTKKIPFLIVPSLLTEETVYTVPTEIVKDKVQATTAGLAKRKAPAVYDAVTGVKLPASDFTAVYGAYDDASKTFPVTIKGVEGGNYVGEVVLDGIHVYEQKLVGSGKKANIAIKDAKTAFYYTGEAITLGAEDFVSTTGYAQYGEDFYIVGYKNNIKSGTAKVTIKATGTKFGGTVTLTFKINKAKKAAQN
ncbi:MAG: hypothetical protein E7307_01995 [Butyrivibrio sp.]|nr:hypothetical protein [Butyrivibrio sp.]